MNIEESVEYLKNCLNDEYNFKNATRKKDKEAIETLLTAYEKEKEKNKLLEENYSSAHEDINWFCENYIHKDKIIAKVMEIKDRPIKDEFITATQGKLNTIIDIESLLDEEE